MALTPHRALHRFAALAVALTMLGTACSATSQQVEEPAPTTATPAFATPAPIEESEPPEELGFVEQPASAEFCDTTANIWMHAAALNLLGRNATSRMNEVAMANVAEWLERATLFDEADESYAGLFAAFGQLQDVAASDFANDWYEFMASPAFASSDAAQLYEAQQVELSVFVNDECESVTVTDLVAQAQARAEEIDTEFGLAPGNIAPSETVPKYSIYTHSTGRLIVTFPTHWTYEEVNGDALVEFIAGEDMAGLLANQSADGVRLRLLPADSVDAFGALLATTAIAQECTAISDEIDEGATRTTITQTFECDDHGATLIGQYSPTRNIGLLIEAGFDQPSPTRGDIVRLSTIANSALWS